jgi:hypothetical protein
MGITIDDYTFELLYKTSFGRYDVIILTSQQNNSNNSNYSNRIILYRSKSGLDMWHYAIYLLGLESLYKVRNEYITGTFIHMKLQHYIYDNYNSVEKRSECEPSDNLLKPSENRMENISELMNNRNKNGKCTSLDNSFTTLYTFLGRKYGIDLQCGSIVTFTENYIQNKQKIQQFITDNKLSVSPPIDTTDTLLIYKYMMYVIYEFLKQNFNFEQVNLYYTYVYNYKKDKRRPNKPIFINIKIYQSIIFSDPTIKYYYYYIKYNYEFRDYYAPLFITPLLSKINQYGMYECFMQSSIYFCKIFEYNSQLYEKKDTRYNKDNPYEFIGDLISEFTLLPPRKQILTLTRHNKLFYFVSNEDTNKIKYEEYLKMVKVVLEVDAGDIPGNSKKHVYIDNTGTYHADSSYIYYHLTNVLKCDSRNEEPYIELQEVSGINRIDEIDISKIKDECFLKYEEESCGQMVGGYKSNILTGNRGGKYIILKGKKRYIKNRK